MGEQISKPKPLYKKTKGTITNIYDNQGNIIDWYTSYPNHKDKVLKYQDLEDRSK